MDGVRFLAEALDPVGGTFSGYTEIELDDEPELTDVLSGPPEATATISIETAELRNGEGELFFQPWRTAIYHEENGQIRAGWLVEDCTFKGEKWQLDLVGFTGYATGQPYTGARYWVGVDPFDLVRHVWEHLQSLPGGNLGIEIDPTAASPVRIGAELADVTYVTGLGETVKWEEGPFKLNWYTNDDLGKTIDDLASGTPFDWHEEHAWDGERIRHFIRLGYPRIGQRHHLHRFSIGENVEVSPDVNQGGDEYATTVIYLGAGEGSEMIRGEASISPPGLRRAVVLTDKNLKSKTQADDAAKAELVRRLGLLTIDSVTVEDHPNAPLSAIQLGNEYRLAGRVEWIEIDQWVRVTSMTTNPGGTSAVLGVQRADLGRL